MSLLTLIYFENPVEKYEIIISANLLNISSRIAPLCLKLNVLLGYSYDIYLVDPAEGIEAIRQVALGTFPGTVIISPKEQALEEANTPRNGQVIWSDGSRLEDGRTGSAAVCRNTAGIWIIKKLTLKDNKEIFDAEL